MQKFILDTNFFVNMEIKSGFGTTSKEVVAQFISIAKPLISEKKAEFLVPPRIQEEMSGFFEAQGFMNDLLTVLTIQSPHITSVEFNASVFYQLIEEIRERSYKGLRIAEESLEAAAFKASTMPNLEKKDFQQSLQEPIKKLRERYRQATRFNFLDSVADLDIIVLAKEVDGAIVSSDEGVIRWGRIFGIKEVLPQQFKQLLHSF